MIIRGDEPIFIIRKNATGAVDQYGNETATTSEILIRDALFAYNDSSDSNEVNRNPKEAKLTIYLPQGTEVRDGDLFEIRETLWVQDGTPDDWGIVNNFEAGVVITVRRHRG